MSARYAYVGDSESFELHSPERSSSGGEVSSIGLAGVPLNRANSAGSAGDEDVGAVLIQPPSSSNNASSSRIDQELINLPRHHDDHHRRLSSLAPPLLDGSDAASVQSGLSTGGVSPPAFYRSKYFRCGCEVFFILLAMILAYVVGSSTVSSSSDDCTPVVAAKRPPVIVVSFDGFRADYLDLAGPSRVPHFTAIRQSRHAVVANSMRPSFPSLTFPNHMTLVTGVHPETHGITANHIYSPALNEYFVYTQHASQGPEWFLSETSWTWAERFNVSAGTAMWVGSETKIHGLQPNVWLPYNGAMPNSERIDTVFSWIDSGACEVCFLYFSDVDEAGHEYGAATPEVMNAVARMDDLVGVIQSKLSDRGLTDTASLILLADHGMATVRQQDGEIYLDDYISLTAHGITHQETGAFTNIWLPPSLPNQAAIVDEILANLTRAGPNLKCWRKEDMPEEFHYKALERIAPINCLCSLGYVTSSRDPSSTWWYDPREKGLHGYDPALAEMHAIFLVQAPQRVDSGVDGQAGRIQEMNNRNVFALVNYLLDVSPAPNNGSLIDFAPFLVRK